jgi:hypothetical protein
MDVQTVYVHTDDELCYRYSYETEAFSLYIFLTNTTAHLEIVYNLIIITFPAAHISGNDVAYW